MQRIHTILATISALMGLALMLLSPIAFAESAYPITAALALDAETEVILSEGGEWVYYSFTPEETDTYTFRSYGECDTLGQLYDEDGILLASDDFSGEAFNFMFFLQLNAGKQYYLSVRLFDEELSGSFTVLVSKTRGLESVEAVEATFVQPSDDDPAIAYVRAPYGTPSFALCVDATTTGGELTYEWTKQDSDGALRLIEDATRSVYWCDEITEPTRYICTVLDEFGKSLAVNFYVLIENRLTVYREGDYERAVTPEEEVTLAVTASCDRGELAYQWYRRVYDPEADLFWLDALDDAVSASITTAPVTQPEEYTCMVTDDFGNSAFTVFYLSVENGFSVRASGEQNFVLDPGEEAVLSVIAECNTGLLSYQWYVDDEVIDGATSSSYSTGIVRSPGEYYCLVTDQYENEEEVWFTVAVDNALAATAVGRERIYVEFGSPVTLTVEASCKQGTLSYGWDVFSSDEDMWKAAEGVHSVNSSSLVIEHVDDQLECLCMVSDEYGNEETIYFEIFVYNDFIAEADGDATVFASPGDIATLKVNAVCREGGLTYSWMEVDEWGDLITELSESSGTLSAGPLTAPAYYNCTVTDQYGNKREVAFTVLIDNEFSAQAENSRIMVSEVSDVTMRVIASCKTGDLAYQWSSVNYDEWGTNYNHVGYESSYTAEQVDSAAKYRCVVLDEFGNEAEIFFDLVWDEGLTASPVGRTVWLVNVGDQLTLQVNANSNDSNLTYEWRANLITSEEGESAYFGDGESMAVTADGSAVLGCQVEDQHNNNDKVSFTVLASEGTQPASLHYSLISITEETACRVLMFSPTTTGNYTFHASADSPICAYIFQEDGTLLTAAVPAGVTEFSLPADLTAGQVYSIAVLFEGYETGDILVGLTATNNPVQHMANRISLPAGTKRIDEEAFADLSIHEVVIPRGCEIIENGAFANCSSLQLINIPDSVRFISDSAFTGSNVILILQGDTEYGEQYAVAHDLGWLYE